MYNLLALGTGAIIGIVVGVLALLILVIVIISWCVSMHNNLIRLKNRVEEAWATIDVQLKKRYDLIPNLVETVKGFAKHEKETLQAVISARQVAMSAGSAQEKVEAENMLSGTLKTLFSLQLEERYPDLKANANFMDLMNQLKYLENEIAAARRYYNGTVREFNTKLEIFPSNIFARRLGYQKKVYFEIVDDTQREPVAVKF